MDHGLRLLPVLCGLLLIILPNLIQIDAVTNEQGKLIEPHDSNARAKFQLPKLFDFERFKQVFKKSYTFLEDVVRNKIFLARAFRVFLSGVAYKYKKRNYYLAINQMSDWTPDEVNSIYPKNNGQSFEMLTIEEKNVVPVASEREIEQTLKELSSHEQQQQQQVSDSAGLESALSKELHLVVSHESESRKKRETIVVTASDDIQQAAEVRNKFNLETDLMKSPDLTDGELQVNERVESNNPNYEQPELTVSSPTNDNNDNKDTNHLLTPKLADKINQQSGTKYLGMLMQGVRNVWHQTAPSMVQKWMQAKPNGEQHELTDTKLRPIVMPSVSTVAVKKTRLPDETFVDIRQVEPDCYHTVRNQSKCGSCYVFAVIALYEWHYCQQKKKRVSFSEQYVVDCGQSVQLNGCDGGLFTLVSKFVLHYGLELRQNYPYRARTDQCPYSPEEVRVNSQKMGYIRMSDYGFLGVEMKDWEKHLKRYPMVINFHAPDDFLDYGGGVDSGETCNTSRPHSMLLIGSGRQDNEEYWLIRNSHSTAWGEQGHYKLNKKSVHCIQTEKAYRLRAPYVDKDATSPDAHVSSQVMQRHQEYIREMAMNQKRPAKV